MPHTRRFKIFLKCVIKGDKVCMLGVKVRNMKMDFNTGGTWRWAMNTNDENYDFFYSAKSLSRNKK